MDNYQEQREEEESQQGFAKYYNKLSARTRRRQQQELERLQIFLEENGQHFAGSLALDACEWAKITCADIARFFTWLKGKNYVASSRSNHLYTIRTYAQLAFEHGFFPSDEYQCLRQIKIAPDEEGQARIGLQKAAPLPLSDKQVQEILAKSDTPREREDALLLALSARCGLWPREIAALNRKAINEEKKTLTFYDYRAEDQKTLHLDAQTLAIAHRYLQDPSPYDALFVGNRKEGKKQQRLTDRAINARMRAIGQQIDLPTLSPHDCHIYWESQNKQFQYEQWEQQYKHFQHEQSSSRGTAAEQQAPETTAIPFTERLPGRKSRPDMWNRRSFEQSMLSQDVPESMIAPLVSEYRLLIPLVVKYLDKEAFFKNVQKELKELNLSPATEDFWEFALEQIEYWTKEQLERYKATR